MLLNVYPELMARFLEDDSPCGGFYYRKSTLLKSIASLICSSMAIIIIAFSSGINFRITSHSLSVTYWIQTCMGSGQLPPHVYPNTAKCEGLACKTNSY